MKKLSILLTLCLATVCGCHTSPKFANQQEGGKLSVKIEIPNYLLQVDANSARILVDGLFAGNYAEPFSVQLSPGKHKIVLQIARADEVRRQNDGTTLVRNFKLAGQETVTVFGGQSTQSLVFTLENLKKTEIELDGGH